MAYVKLTPPQLLELRASLRAAFNKAALSDLLNSIQRVFEDYAGDDTYPVQVMAVVKAAEQESWVMELLAAARAQRPADPNLERIEREFAQVALPHGFDPYEICCLSGEYVMVNRKDLRRALRGMSDPNGKRILVVRDKSPPANDTLLGTKTGKSLSVQMISALNQQLGGFELVWIDLRQFNDSLGTSALIQPRDLALRLVRQLRYDVDSVPEAPVDSQWSRWGIEFCDDFEPQARADQRKVWIVIDEFNKVSLPQGTLDLIKQLADRVRVTLPHFRLVLLGYRDTFGPDVLKLVDEERIERAISIRDVVEFLIGAAKQRRLTPTETSIEDEAVKALSGLDPSADGYLEEVGQRALAALKRLAAAGP
jgi:hypothetical protein